MSRPSAEVRLFCFPYAGGTAKAYARWFARLPPRVEVLAMQPPGRFPRDTESAATDFPQMVEQVRSALLPYLDRPFVFYGHSLGALIALEVCHALIANGDPGPAHLCVGGHPGPSRHVAAAIPEGLSDEALRVAVARLGIFSRELVENAESWAMVVPQVRADLLLSASYARAARKQLHLPLTVFAGNTDPLLASGLDAWLSESTGPVDFERVEGDHMCLDQVLERLAHGHAASWGHREAEKAERVLSGDAGQTWSRSGLT